VGKLYVVRHADAGQRSEWKGPDATRPLSHRGERQATGLRKLLADSGATRLVASPFHRCIQTLEPLGEELGLPVEADARLAEGTGARGVLEVAGEVADAPAVVCSHGDVIPDLLEALVKGGLKLHDELRWQKASTWVLSRDGGRLAKARYLPPPS
jgi:broad specificity phosphatase PhoE